MVRHFWLFFLGTSPRGWIWKFLKGGDSKGPAMRPSWTSWSRFPSIKEGCWLADGRFFAIRGKRPPLYPTRKPWLNPTVKLQTNFWSGWFTRSSFKRGMLIGVWGFRDCSTSAAWWLLITMAFRFWRGVIVPVGWVVSIAGFAAMTVGARILAASGTPVVVVTGSSWGSWIGPEGREGAPISKMVPTPTYGTGRFSLPSKLK